MAAAKAAADLGSAAFPQAITAALLNDMHDDIAKWRREWLRARHDALTEALRAALPGWTWPEPDGGLTLWVRLPGTGTGPADSGAFAQAALRHGVAVVPGRLLSASGGRGRNQPGERIPAPGLHPGAGRPGQVGRGSGGRQSGQDCAVTPGPSRSARSW